MTFKQHISQHAIALLAIVALAISSFTAQAQLLNPNARKAGSIREQIENSNLQNSRNDFIKEILDFAYQFRGVPYRHGAASPRAFDCSGFTSYVFKQFGINLDRTSRGQIYDGERVNRNELQPGDLVFFNGRAVGNRIGHVGIVTAVDTTNRGGFNFIHAARTGITVSHSSETYYSRRYMGACRVVK